MSSKPLKSIKTSLLSRGLALTKTSFSIGAQMASHAIGSLVSDKDKSERLKDLLTSQMELLSGQIGELKGSLQKAGQMLSMYGEYFLPAEANAFLRKLQNQTVPVEWDSIHKALMSELGEEKLSQLEIETTPIGTASLGQVHKAKIKNTNEWIALKVQYPGVDKAIDTDLFALKKFLSIAKVLPDDARVDEIFLEVREMLKQEVDYSHELKMTVAFKDIVNGDSRFIVPKVYSNFSTAKVLATEFIEAAPILSEDVLSLPQDRKNKLGIAITELFLRELYELGLVQTDPHFGNYLVKINDNSHDQLVLLDFGATRKYEDKFLKPYLEMVRGAILRQPDRVIKGNTDLGFIKSTDTDEFKNMFVELCYEICEPFAEPHQPWTHSTLMNSEGVYDWQNSDLPQRLAKRGTAVALEAKFRAPPREVIFLDRKMTGLFIFLQKLGVKMNSRALVMPYLFKD